MNYTKDVKENLANLENRGYVSAINPVSKQLQVKKNCQLTVDKFNNVDADGSIKWSARQGSDALSTPVVCTVLNTDIKVTATLYKKSFDANDCTVGSTYSAMITMVLTERGKNSLNPNYKNAYFTLFSNAGNVVSSDALASAGLQYYTRHSINLECLLFFNYSTIVGYCNKYSTQMLQLL